MGLVWRHDLPPAPDVCSLVLHVPGRVAGYVEQQDMHSTVVTVREVNSLEKKKARSSRNVLVNF